ncbi:hypothetical protein NXC14_CH03316 [Rhizobium sp. NXC14]|nr:hypothetical protein NXC14_CH03316 [Rhizobium sp. NXC14]
MQEPCAVRGKDFALRENGKNPGIRSEVARRRGWSVCRGCAKSRQVMVFRSSGLKGACASSLIPVPVTAIQPPRVCG